MNTTIKQLILTDWAPHIEKTVRIIAIPIAAAYVAGLMVGQFVHQLNDAITALVTPRQAAPIDPRVTYRPECVNPDSTMAPIVQQACRPVIARCGIAPQTDMDRAVLAVQAGSSQAAAARRYNVSRSTLRRRLAK
jgi:hypothetical protein